MSAPTPCPLCGYEHDGGDDGRGEGGPTLLAAARRVISRYEDGVTIGNAIDVLRDAADEVTA